MSAQPLDAALDALLDPGPETILATESAITASGWPRTLAKVVPDRALSGALRDSAAPVVFVHRVAMTVVRTLRSHPVPLLVATADAEASRWETLEALEGTTLLGPDAQVRRHGEGPSVCCAAEADELEGLLRALGGAHLAVSPTPSWWWRLLDRRGAKRRPVAGYVPAAVLDEDWARWGMARDRGHALVPIGVPEAPIDEPAHPDLAVATAAHALERLTGPVFPSPRVIATVLEGQRGTSTPARQKSHDAAIWQQARRALPMTGAVVGMEGARPELATQVATAAFLAQRALLRVDAAKAALRSSISSPAPADADGLERAQQVLVSAGQTLTDHESKVVLRGFGIEVTRQAVASSASGAAGFADRIGFPVVLKALSPDLRRRAEIGAVQLSIPTAAAVRRAYADVVDAVERNAPTARLDGVLVAEMVDPGLDLHCGAIRLPQGGIALFGRCVGQPAPVEPVLSLSPLAPDDARLLAHAILGRVPVPALRRATDPDTDDLAMLLMRLDMIVQEHADRIELVELRPLRLLSDGSERRYVTLDARIIQQPHLQGR
ncbi:MAG: acetate--CoA ligase family protein [Myxococcota bacterium]